MEELGSRDGGKYSDEVQLSGHGEHTATATFYKASDGGSEEGIAQARQQHPANIKGIIRTTEVIVK